MCFSSSGRVRCTKRVRSTWAKVRGSGAGGASASTASAVAFSRWAAAIRVAMTSAGIPASRPSRCLASLRSHSMSVALARTTAGVLAMSLGIGLYELPGGGLDALRCEHPGEPGVHMREQSVLAHRQARRVVVHRHWVVAASVTAVEGMSAGRVALELLLAAVTDHQTVHWRTELLPRAGVGCTWSKVHGGRHAILVAWRRLPMDAR